MIFNVTIVIIWGHHGAHPYKTENLIENVVCVLTAPPTGRAPASLPLLRPLCPLRHNNIEIRASNNPASSSKCPSERKSRMSLTSNQNLEMLKLSEEGLWKAD